MIKPLGRKYSPEKRLRMIMIWRRLRAFVCAWRGASEDMFFFGTGAYEEGDHLPYGYRHIPANEIVIPAPGNVKLFKLQTATGFSDLVR